MNRQQLIARLNELPAEIEQAENKVVQVNQELTEAKNALQARETAAITNGEVQGKNETQRKAELKALTAAEQEAVTEKENQLAEARVELNKKQNEFRALRSIALLMGGEPVAN